MNRFPPRKILVAFDFTKRSREAWRYAGMLARVLGAELRAVHVAGWTIAPDGMFVAPNLTPQERAQLQKTLDDELGGPGLGRLAEGDLVGEILTAARELGAELIVMGTEGRTGLMRLTFGSLTEAVVRVSPVPVLSLQGSVSPPRSVLAPVSVEEYSVAGFHFAEDVARALRLPITLLHVRQEGRPFDRLDMAADAARKLWGLRVDFKVVDGPVVRRILDASKRHGLVVLVAHKRGVFRDGLLGTTAEQVLRRSTTPVLCVPSLRTVAKATRRSAAKPSARAGSSRRIARRRGLRVGW